MFKPDPFNLPPYARPHWVPTYRMYSPATIFLAATFGWFIGGFLLIGANYRAVGRNGLGWIAWISGFAYTILFSVIAYLMYSRIHPSFVYGIGFNLVFGLAWLLQGKTYKAHIAAGGPSGEWWKVGIALLVPMGFFVLLLFGFAALDRLTAMPPPIEVNARNLITVYGIDGVTKSEAAQLAETLAQDEWYGRSKHQCGLMHTNSGFVVNFIVKPAAWEKPATVRNYTLLCHNLNQRLPQMAPWTFLLQDKEGNVHLTLK